MEGEVNEIIAFISSEDVVTPATITTWDNAVVPPAASIGSKRLRLAMNVDVRMTTTLTDQSILKHSITGHPLATWLLISSDGNGKQDSGFKTSGPGLDNLLYVGGGSSAWETQEGLIAGQLLGSSGMKITKVVDDGGCILTLGVAALNGEDFGSDSDFTEAPDAGIYTGAVTLLVTAD